MSEQAVDWTVSPVTGRHVAYWRTCCGSFAANGLHGSANDYVTHAFLVSCDGPRKIDRIVVSPDVMAFLICVVAAISRLTAERTAAELITLSRAVQKSLPPSSENIQELMRLMNHLADLLLAEENVRTLYGAEIEIDREAFSQIDMYRDGELVAELTGWTP